MLKIKDIKYEYQKKKKNISYISTEYIYFKEINKIIQIYKIRKVKLN